MSGSRELLCLVEPRAGFGVGCHCPGHRWKLKLQRAAQDSLPGSEINPSQQAFHTSREHEPGVAFPGIALLCPCLPCPPTGLSVHPCLCGAGGSHQAGGARGNCDLSQPSSAGQMWALPRCPHCPHCPCGPCCACYLHCLRCPQYLLPTLPARCQPAKVSNKSCPYSQKPVIDLFSPPTRHGVPGAGDNAISLPSGSRRAAI